MKQMKLAAVEKTEPKLYSAAETGDYAKPEEFMEIRPVLVGFLMAANSEKQAVDGLMKLAQIFTRFEDTTDVADFAGDVQRYLFTWTREHSEALDKYLKSIGVEPDETESPISPLALQLSAIMQNPDTPEKVKTAIGELLCELHSEGEGVENKEYTPEYVEILLNANKPKLRAA